MFDPNEIKGIMKEVKGQLIESIKIANEELNHETKPSAEFAFLYLTLARTQAAVIITAWETLYRSAADADQYMRNDDAFKDIIAVIYGINRAGLRVVRTSPGGKTLKADNRDDFYATWKNDGANMKYVKHWIFDRVHEIEGFDAALDAIEFKEFDKP